MKTLREEWTDFFSRENLVLSQNYPGLNLHRFLMEVRDILKLKFHPLIDLDQALYSVSARIMRELKGEFIQGIPFAYLTHHSEFYGRSIYINENVLIPRQETELLVDHLVQKAKKTSFKKVLDVGTGSGVIILNLLIENVAESGLAADLSQAALSVAKINAKRLRLENRCEFVLSDRLQNVSGTFDLIVSNPPYIKQKGHRELVHRKVDEFEPELALYLPDETYDQWFKEFFQQIRSHLSSGGIFMMEGHELELENQAQQLSELGFNQVEVMKDYTGSPRFLCAVSSAPKAHC